MDLATVTRTVRVGEHEFPVVDHGEGPAVLLLHGFPDSRHLWRHQVPALAEAGFRVLAPDLRGFGDAPKPAGVDSYALPLVIGEGPWRYERMEGVSHWLMLDRPDELNRLLIGFLSGVEDAVEGGD